MVFLTSFAEKQIFVVFKRWAENLVSFLVANKKARCLLDKASLLK
ncbi:hypothetical protein AL07_11350 [Corynebacterium diphtheriae bv. gravis str. ISS 4060]|nr:hypothetical protein AL07_11350 [Corynebacterium diphtheriae bv. gravis str. ISS 4060]